jgi:hypothetical protein
MGRQGSDSSGRVGIRREDVPGAKPHADEPEIVLEPDISSDGRIEEGRAEIRPLPVRPELSPPGENANK